MAPTPPTGLRVLAFPFIVSLSARILFPVRLRTLAPLAALLFLMACSSAGSSPTAACSSQYWNGTIGTCLPEGWIVLSQEEMQARGMPPEVVVAFQAGTAVSGQFPTVTVTREHLTQAATSSAYSKASMEVVARRADYTKIDEQNLSVAGASVTLHIFSAQPISEEPRLRFYQVGVAKDDTGYVFTGALPLTSPDALAEEVTLILSNITFTAPAA